MSNETETDLHAYKEIELVDVISYQEIIGSLGDHPFDIQLFINISYCPKAKHIYTIKLKRHPSFTLYIFDRFHILTVQPFERNRMILVFRSVYSWMIRPSKINSLVEEETYLAAHLEHVRKDIENLEETYRATHLDYVSRDIEFLMVSTDIKYLVDMDIMEPFIQWVVTNSQDIAHVGMNKYHPMSRFDYLQVSE